MWPDEELDIVDKELEDMEAEMQEIEQEIAQLEARGIMVIPKEAWDDPSFQPLNDAITLEYLYYTLEQMRSGRHARHHRNSRHSC